jgi:PTH1 family peptidyl-tRNA hydrolase
MSNIFDLFKKIETQSSAEPVSFIIVGLGNIGKQYERTRHNIGFLAIDHIAEKYGAKIDRVKFHSTVGEANIGGARVLLMKPSTLMNNSGIAVGEAAAFYKIPPERVLVLHDEISFEPGVFRIRRKGSAGGHNGLKSIIAHLGSENFPRIKLGVGAKPHPEYDLADWVLSTMTDAGMGAFLDRLGDVFSAVELIIKGDIDGAMSRYSH